MRRSLRFYRHRHVAVAAGAAVACAVLTGALLVGDSVRGSLRDLALERLGATDLALVGQGFVSQTLAGRLEAALRDGGGDAARVVSLLSLPGTAVAAESRARASRVTVLGVEGSFATLWPASTLDFEEGGGGQSPFPPVILNEPLQRELGVEPGDAVVLSFSAAAEVPRGSLMGRRDAGEVLETLRLTVAAVVPTTGPGAFSLASTQIEPLNAFVPLDRLQRALGQPGRINTLLVAGTPGAEGRAMVEAARDRVLELADLGLRLERRGSGLELTNDRFVLRASTVEAVQSLAHDLGATTWPLRSYLANTIEVVSGAGYVGGGPSAAGPAGGLDGHPRVPPPPHTGSGDLGVGGAAGGSGAVSGAGYVGGGPSAAGTAGGLDGVGGRFLAYAAAVGFEGPPAGFGDLLLLDGSPAPELGEDQALLNEWAARRLDARVGDVLEISYFRVGEGERLVSEEHRLELAGVVRMSGLGADPSLTPDYPGISDSDDISDWDPPFPVDLDLVTPDDEAYWDDLRGAPKLFVGAATASRLWSSRYGDVTALRIAPAAGADLDGLRRAVETDLPHAIDPSAFGLDLEPVRHQALAAAVGATDFAQLFVAFSWFLILAAALLVGLLFGLGVEQRAAEVGLLRAVGFREATVRRRFLVEGFVVGALGCGVGVVLAVGYAALLMRGLRTWWLPAVGSRELTLHLSVVSLAVGFASSLAVVVLAIFVVLRRLRRVSAPVLLAGSVDPEDRRRRGRLARGAVALGALLVVGLSAVALAAGGGGAAVFFGLGAGVLLLGLGLFSLWCRSRGGTSVHSAVLTSGRLGLWRLAVRNSARNPGRSILSVTLVACACFVLVAAAANRRDLTAVDHGRESGTGGYALVARSDVPLFDDLNEPDGRYELGLPDDEALWQDVRVYSLRRLPGDDASCLNLYRPESPQVLGVSRAFRDRGGFHFHATASPTDDPWSLLDEDLDTDEITGAPLVPAVADFESATWILKLGLGDDVVLSGSDGQPLHLRLVGLLDASLFQSEILISEEQMLRHFPTVEGYSDFLIDAPAAKASEVATMLEAGLGGFGFDATGAAEKLASFKAVQNTYLSTFQTLGGLGLLLGTLGLAVVLTRNVYERRDELAALRAFGFRRSLLRTLILEESVVLLLLGMLLGTGAALIGVAPYLSAAGAAVPWRSLLLTLAAVFLAGLAACGLAASRALRGELLPQLRGE